MGGNDGQAWGAAGSRGDAVATVSTAGPLLFMNTTVSGTQATVTPDVNWDAEMADLSEAVQATAGLPGKPGCNREDDPVECAPALISGDGATAALFGGEPSCGNHVTESQCAGAASVFASTWAPPESSGLSTGDGLLSGSTTIASESDGVDVAGFIGAGSLDVGSTAGFPDAGALTVATTDGMAQILTQG